MYGYAELEPLIEVAENTVTCPVKDCTHTVARQRGSFKSDPKYLCPDHDIIISPSTFEYVEEESNLLWKDSHDMDLLKRIKLVKRESRMAHDNSEDAVTWNVFRFLEKSDLTAPVLSSLLDTPVESPQTIYWSYCQSERCNWSELNKARIEFGEKISQSSEPDLIVLTDNAIILIEAKLMASNDVPDHDPSNRKEYETGGGCWFSRVFSCDYESIAVAAQKYELMRFWLLRTWLAAQHNLDFYLVSLTRQSKEVDIEERFRDLVVPDPRRHFLRFTWEDIHNSARNLGAPDELKRLMVRYYTNKTIGYDNRRRLCKAFDLSDVVTEI